MKKIRILSLTMVCSMLFCTPIMAAEITTTEDAVIENNPEVVTESLESGKLEEMSPDVYKRQGRRFILSFRSHLC